MHLGLVVCTNLLWCSLFRVVSNGNNLHLKLLVMVTIYISMDLTLTWESKIGMI